MPADDHHHWRFAIAFKRSGPLNHELAKRRTSMLDVDYRFEQQRSNRYLQDREEMKTSTFAGFGTVFVTGDEPFALDHVGAILSGTFQHEALGDCLGEAAETTGSRLRRTEVSGLPAIAGVRGDSRAVFVGRRGVVFGPEPTAVQTIATIRDGSGSASETALGLIFRDVAGRDLTLAARIPPRWRDQLEVDGELAQILAHLEAVALGARIRRGLSASLRLLTDDPAAADALAGIVRERLDAVLDTPMIGFTPVAGALRRVEVASEGTVVTVAFDWSDERLDELLDFAADLEGRPGGLAGALDRVR
ncbi:MAG: hypothetical protein CMN30_21475 [Sandaracinus sp.]|nr:hypothetical protein [Sandaracinus sp.]